METPIFHGGTRVAASVPLSHLSYPDSGLLHGSYNLFARRAASTATSELGCETSATLASVERSTWAGLVARLAAGQECILQLETDDGGVAGVAWFSVEISLAILEQILGWSSKSGQEPRELTELERCVVEPTMRAMVANLSAALPESGFHVGRVETQVRGFRRTVPGEPLLVAEFTFVVNGRSGQVCVALPASRLERLSTPPETGPTSSPEQRDRMLTLLRPGTLEFDARIARQQVRIGDLLGLKTGDILRLPLQAGTPLNGCLNGTPVCLGSVYLDNGRPVFRLEETEPARNDSTEPE